MKLFGYILLSSLAFFASVPAKADDTLSGAAAVIQRLPAPGQPAAPQMQSASDSYVKLSSDLRAFRAVSKSLAPHDAASQWVSLAYRMASMPNSFRRPEDQSISLSQLIAALPPPDAWSDISTMLDSQAYPGVKRTRREILQLLGHILIDDFARQQKDLAALREHLAKTGAQPYVASTLQAVADTLDTASGDPKVTLASTITTNQSGYPAALDETPRGKPRGI